MNGAEVASDEYERLAVEILAVEAGNFAEVREAMRKILMSAPDGTNVAFLLSRAIAHASDQALETLTCSAPDRPYRRREATT